MMNAGISYEGGADVWVVLGAFVVIFVFVFVVYVYVVYVFVNVVVVVVVVVVVFFFLLFVRRVFVTWSWLVVDEEEGRSRSTFATGPRRDSSNLLAARGTILRLDLIFRGHYVGRH